MKKHLNRINTSNYSKNWQACDTESVVGKMKDEYAGIWIFSFYEIATKSYYVSVGDKEIMTSNDIWSLESDVKTNSS